MLADTLLFAAVWLPCGVVAVVPSILRDWKRYEQVTVGDILFYFLVVLLGGLSLGISLMNSTDTVVFRKKREDKTHVG